MKKDRTKRGPTPKQNKWKDPFFARRVMMDKKRSWGPEEWLDSIEKMRNKNELT